MMLIKEFCVFIKKWLSLFQLHLVVGRPDFGRMRQCGGIKWGGKNLIHGHIKCLRKDEKGKEKIATLKIIMTNRSIYKAQHFCACKAKACPFA